MRKTHAILAAGRPKAKKKPAYTLHRATGQARVRINGRDIYLGAFGSPESRDRYDELIGEWVVKRGAVDKFTLTLDDLSLLFLEHAEQHYRKNGVMIDANCISGFSSEVSSRALFDCRL